MHVLVKYVGIGISEGKAHFRLYLQLQLKLVLRIDGLYKSYYKSYYNNYISRLSSDSIIIHVSLQVSYEVWQTTQVLAENQIRSRIQVLYDRLFRTQF